jgi:hypothetical protein
MTADEVFDGYDFRTNGGREGTTFYFRGHLTAEEIAATYSRTYPNPEATGSYRIDAASGRHAWHVFTQHEDGCYLIAAADGPFDLDRDYDLCTCKAAQSRQNDGRGYEYRHPHPATKRTPGAIPVTWVTAA